MAIFPSDSEQSKNTRQHKAHILGDCNVHVCCGRPSSGVKWWRWKYPNGHILPITFRICGVLEGSGSVWLFWGDSITAAGFHPDPIPKYTSEAIPWGLLLWISHRCHPIGQWGWKFSYWSALVLTGDTRLQSIHSWNVLGGTWILLLNWKWLWKWLNTLLGRKVCPSSKLCKGGGGKDADR